MVELHYKCEKCGTVMAIDSQHSGHSINCIECDSPAMVPIAGSYMDIPVRRCPTCNDPISSAAMLCTNCGTNLVTGKRVGQKSYAVMRRHEKLQSLLSLLVIVVVGYGGFHYYKTTQRKAEQARLHEERMREEQRAIELAEENRLQKEKEQLLAEETRLQYLAEKEQRNERARQRARELEKQLFDLSTISVRDLISTMSMGGNPVLISIDPQAADMVSDLRLTDEEARGFETPEGRNDWFGRNHLVVKKLPFSETDRESVEFVATQAMWVYFSVIEHLRRGNLEAALKTISTAHQGSPEPSALRSQLYNIIAELGSQHSETLHLSKTAESKLAKTERISREALMALRADEVLRQKRSGGRGGGKAYGRTVIMRSKRTRSIDGQNTSGKALERLEAALKELVAVVDDLVNHIKQMEQTNNELVKYHNYALNNNLLTEAACLLTYYLDSYQRLRYTADKVGQIGVLTDEVWFSSNSPALGLLRISVEKLDEALPETPRQIAERRAALSANLRSLENQVKALRVKIGLNTSEQDHDILAALHVLKHDKNNLRARTALGLHYLNIHTQTARSTLSEHRAPSILWRELGADLVAKKKHGLLAAFNSVTGSEGGASTPSTNQVGFANSLALSASKTINSLVQVQVRRKSAGGYGTAMPGAIPAAHTGYWASWNSTDKKENRAGTVPIVFKNDAAIGRDTKESAMEVYHWLSTRFQPEMANKELYIAGDNRETGGSGGLALALAAYSALLNRPMLADMACAGRLDADGEVIEAASVYESIQAAVETSGLEIVIIPAANASETMLLPLDVLCRLTIIAVEDIDDCLEYAFHRENKVLGLSKLRKAQIYIMSGQIENAKPLLLEVATEFPEIYSARRLLELMAFSRR